MTYMGIDPGYTQVIYRSTPPPAPDAATDRRLGHGRESAGRQAGVRR